MWILLIFLGRLFLYNWKGVVFDICIIAGILIQSKIPELKFDYYFAPFYFLLSILIFFASILLATDKPFSYLKKVFSAAKNKINFDGCTRQLIVVLHEELIYRVFMQSFLISQFTALTGILTVAIGFTFWHRFTLPDAIWHWIEFLIFSLLLGLVFFYTKSIVFIIIIHLTRNVAIKIAINFEKNEL